MPSAPTVTTVKRVPAPRPAPVPAETNEPSTRALATVVPPAPPPAETNVVLQSPPVVVPQPAPPLAPALRQMDPSEVRILVIDPVAHPAWRSTRRHRLCFINH